MIRSTFIIYIHNDTQTLIPIHPSLPFHHYHPLGRSQRLPIEIQDKHMYYVIYFLLDWFLSQSNNHQFFKI